MNNTKQNNILPPGSIIKGKELESFLLSGIEDGKEKIIEHLANFDGNDLFPKWLVFLRCVDEYINLLYVLTQAELRLLEKCDINLFQAQSKREFQKTMEMIRSKFGDDVFKRIRDLTLMLSCIKLTYKQKELPGMDFHNMAEAIWFCQSRRLYYVAYLSLIRLYAKGLYDNYNKCFACCNEMPVLGWVSGRCH